MAAEQTKCPDCKNQYAGDVAATTIAFTQAGRRIRLFYRSDMYKPAGEATPNFDSLVAARKLLLDLRDTVLDYGEGPVAQAVALAKAEQAKNPVGLPGIFRGASCRLVRAYEMIPPPPDKIVCAAYAEGAVIGGTDDPLSAAEVEIAQLPNGPIKVSKL